MLPCSALDVPNPKALSCRKRLLYFVPDSGQDGIQILQHLKVREAKNLESLIAKGLIASKVPFLIAFVPVLPAIHLYDPH